MNALLKSLGHPTELYSLIKFKLTVNDSTSDKTEPKLLGKKYDPDYTRAMCYYFLNQTSRSFARVIHELDDELRHPVCLFYLILRGLDTIEDDMTIPIKKKTELLLQFHKSIYKKGWTFDGNGPLEKDRDLLVRFDLVIEEFLRLEPKFQTAIADITRRMGIGMAEFRDPDYRVVTMQDYNLYTHYVAGLVGIGLTKLFVASGLESPKLESTALLPTEKDPKTGGEGGPQSKDLANRMGLFLQKVNILKDYLQDLEEGRVFWPEEVWSLYANDIGDFADPSNISKSLACLNHLCADALTLFPDCLEYLSRLKTRSVFQFCAIPQMMALASIVLFFNNPRIFKEKTSKIRRGQAVEIILESTNIENVKLKTQKLLLELHRKNKRAVDQMNLSDKSFVKMSGALAKIQQWLNSHTIKTVPGQQKIGQKPLLLTKTAQSWSVYVLIIGISLFLNYIINRL